MLKRANPGDTIEITHMKTKLFGKRFVVISPPSEKAARRIPTIGSVWIFDETDGLLFIPIEHYKIIERLATKETKSVDSFLKQQTDDNLDSVFG